MKTGMIALLAGTALLPAIAHAQGSSAEQQSDVNGDIVVTAQRYEQRLQDVPLSISAVGSREIKARNAQALKDMEYSIPGLSTYEYGVGQQTMQLRGISNVNGAATVGTYLDETPLALDSAGNEFQIKLLDMERVEVLRGPQATLYGQGSMGGTIRYIPAAPRLDAVSGSVEGQWSSTKGGANNYSAQGAINLPLATDKIGARIAASYEHIGGYIDQPATGSNNINQAHIYQVRGILLLRPTELLDVSFLGLYQKAKQDAQNFAVNDVTSTLTGTPAADRFVIAEAKAAYDLDFATLSGSASYINRRMSNLFDITPFYLPLLPQLGVPAGSVDTISLITAYRYKIFNSELRLASHGTGPFRWALGMTYRDLDTHTLGSSPTGPNQLPFEIFGLDQPQKNRSFAIYGEATYAITPELKATVGVRYYRERKTQTSIGTNFGVTVVDVNKGTFDTLNPRFNLSYDFSPDSMAYVNLAKGFRSGGFNNTSAGGGVFTVQPTFEPDQIWTYEAGTKHQLFDGKLILDASVYRSVWSKVQSATFVPGSAIQIVTNAGHVEGWGVDFSTTARPATALTLTGTFGWNNLAFDKATGDKIPGDPVDGAVRTSYSASIDYRPAITDSVDGIFRVDYQHAGKSQLTLRNFGGQVIPRPGRDLVNLRVGAAFGPVEVALFANNLFNERNPLIVGPFGVFLEDLAQRPRVIGVSASAGF